MIARLGTGSRFPDPAGADDSVGGLLAVGGDLTSAHLLDAYAHGIFPWFERKPVLWWSPDPRAVIRPDQFKVPRSLAKRIRNGGFTVTFDTAFREVIARCAAPRDGARGTWITADMQRAYLRLHDEGFAHSIESWLEGRLVGGLYGISLGSMFFGESMFSTERDASKVAFHALCRRLESWSFDLIDCQLENPHLTRLGVGTIPRADFLAALAVNRERSTRVGAWTEPGGAIRRAG
jgi:leucyl/phenylalanyl-tRNA--protein transferase